MRLNVGRLRAKDGLGAVNGQLFGHIHKLTPAVVALAWIAFGILIGQLRALRHQHRG